MSIFRKHKSIADKSTLEDTGLNQKPDPLYQNMNNYILIILDSCRYNSFLAAKPKNIMKLGSVERRYSYATWTAPSHYNLLMGLLPHCSPTNVFASDYYKIDFIKYNERFGTANFEFKNLIPQLYIPSFLRNKLGYNTYAFVSLPVLNPKTPINTGFDVYTLMERHNDMATMIDKMHFSSERPSFYILNVGETHYPYALPDEPPDQWPKIHGVHGVFKHLDDHIVGGKLVEENDQQFFDQAKLDELKHRQINAVKYLDTVFEKLFDILPENTYVTVTSDHGELFGEDGYFGHGPIMHELVFEVPFIEGKIK
jgi:hypothetical protein